MKVVHMCLSNYFADGFLYQENELVRQHVADGHDVTVLASTETFDAAGMLVHCSPSDYQGVEGARVLRLPYRRGLPLNLAVKIRMHPGVYGLLERFRPDVIMFHGSAGWELITTARYVQRNPDVILHIDSHGDAINSARNWLSKNILHRLFYGLLLRRAMKFSGPLLCVSPTVMDFAEKIYNIPPDRLEFFPLGGQVLSDFDRIDIRRRVRADLGLQSDTILIVQSGKLDKKKKLAQSLRALSKIADSSVRFIIAGVLQENVRAECEALIAADSRVQYLGWVKSDRLTELLCAADVYLQPGTQSVTMQHSLCCACAVILDAIPAHRVYMCENGWLVENERQLSETLAKLDVTDLAEMGAKSLNFARKHLNYASLARRVLSRA